MSDKDKVSLPIIEGYRGEPKDLESYSDSKSTRCNACSWVGSDYKKCRNRTISKSAGNSFFKKMKGDTLSDIKDGKCSEFRDESIGLTENERRITPCKHCEWSRGMDTIGVRHALGWCANVHVRLHAGQKYFDHMEEFNPNSDMVADIRNGTCSEFSLSTFSKIAVRLRLVKL